MDILGKRSSFRTDADYLLNASCILITVKKIITADIFELVRTEKLRQFGGFVVEIFRAFRSGVVEGFRNRFCEGRPGFFTDSGPSLRFQCVCSELGRIKSEKPKEKRGRRE